MRSACVVVDPPFFDDPSGLDQAGEEMLVETLLAQPAMSKTTEESIKIGYPDLADFDAKLAVDRSRASFSVDVTEAHKRYNS